MKELLSQNGSRSIERDLAKDAPSLEESEQLEDLTTPVTAIDGEVFIGVNSEES